MKKVFVVLFRGIPKLMG